MKRMILISALVLMPMLTNAGWIRTYEINQLSIGRSVRQTADGGYIIAGQCGDENQSDLLLIKTDSLGDTMWTRIYGGGDSDVGRCVQKTNDGGYIISGFANVEADMWPMGDIWLLKTDANGDTIWTRFYRGGSCAWGGWVEQTSDGGYILTSNWNSAYLLLLKTDENGNTMWSKNYQWGDNWEIGYCVRQTWDGGYIVATNLGLFKTDENGDSVWLKPWAGHFVALTDDGSYFVLSGQNNDMWLIKTDEQGDTLWT
ncbi:MAG: hypothetical protein U9Q76_06015, partial [candidate division WOR-3 bacterium]|nr:hypothetical protein [candidate division WOR-3 bacterium]